MYKILEKKTLNANTKQMVIDAPHVAKKAQPGQFIILRVDEDGERIPLTIASYDREKGTIMIIFQEVGATTKKLGLLNEGDFLHDFVGPRIRTGRPQEGRCCRRRSGLRHRLPAGKGTARDGR